MLILPVVLGAAMFLVPELAHLRNAVRVQGAPSGSPSTHADAPARLLAAVPAPASTAYQVMETGSDGRPITWSPCRPIHYVVRGENIPEGGREAVDAAFARLSQVTGLAVVADGLSDEPIERERPAYQPARYGDRWAPVLVVWGKRTDLAEFMGDIAGMAGPSWAQGGDGVQTYVTGQVFLDAEKFHEITVQWGSGAPAESVILHELGHLVGLEHAPEEGQLMWSRGVSGPPWDYRDGDLAGLAAMGRGPCNRDV